MRWIGFLQTILFLALISGGPALAGDPLRASVEITVVDETGKGVPNVIVRVLEDGPTTASEPTDAAGITRIPRPMAPTRLTMPVVATSPDGALKGYREWRFRSLDEAQKPPSIELLPASELPVHVTDSAGDPVGDALVALMVYGASVASQARTDADGFVRMRYPARSEPRSVIALKSGVGFDNWTAYPEVDRQEWKLQKLPAQLSLKLERTNPIRIRTIDRLGNPVPGVAFVPRIMTETTMTRQSFDECQFADAITDAQGIATFDWLPPRGTSLFQARAIGALRDRETRIAVDLRPDRRSPQTFNFHFRRPGAISGRITTADGKPAAGIVVLAQGTDDNGDNQLIAVRSAADGSYWIEAVARFFYLVGIEDDDWAAEMREGIWVNEGETVSNVDFRLSRGTLLHGTLSPIDPERQSPIWLSQYGAAIPRPREGAAPMIPYIRRLALPDSKGRYEFRVGSGRYFVSPARPTVRSTEILVTNEPELVRDLQSEANRNEMTGPARLELGMGEPGSALLTGSVVDSEGSPVPRATIQAHYTLPGRGPQGPLPVIVDANGRFQLERPLTTIWLFAQSEDGELAGSMELDAKNNSAELKLAPAARVVGRLIQGDMPAPGIKVALTFRVQGAGRGGRVVRSNLTVQAAFTDDRGRFELPGAVVGHTYSVAIRDNSGGSASRGLQSLTIAHPGLFDVGYFGDALQLTSMNDGVTWHHPDALGQLLERFETNGQLATRVADALADAARDHRQVLLVAGLPGTQATRSAFEILEGLEDAENFEAHIRRQEARRNQNPEAENELKRPLADYHRVYVNARNREDAAHLAKVYRIDVSRMTPPVLAILNDKGRVAVFKWFGYADDSAKLDEESLREFIKLRRLEPANAEKLLAAALDRAKDEEKKVLLVQVGFDSYPSHLMGRFIDRQRALFDGDYVTLFLDTYRTIEGAAVIKRYRQAGDSLPWIAVLDAEGTKRVDSDTPDGNIGFPSEPESIDDFIDRLIKPTANRLTGSDLESLRSALRRK